MPQESLVSVLMQDQDGSFTLTFPYSAVSTFSITKDQRSQGCKRGEAPLLFWILLCTTSQAWSPSSIKAIGTGLQDWLIHARLLQQDIHKDKAQFRSSVGAVVLGRCVEVSCLYHTACDGAPDCLNSKVLSFLWSDFAEKGASEFHRYAAVRSKVLAVGNVWSAKTTINQHPEWTGDASVRHKSLPPINMVRIVSHNAIIRSVESEPSVFFSL